MEEPAGDETVEGVYSKAKASKFHFKSGSKHRSKRHKSADCDENTETYRHDDASRRSHRDSRRKHKHKHRSERQDRPSTSTRDGAYYDPDYRHRESLYDGLYTSDAPEAAAAPEEAFRESLFDALADDEGAAYWEGVYGQPVHIYPDMKPGPDGKLERMSEEEYADYVRTKMWKKSHQHILQEREAKEKARQNRKEQRQHLDEDNEREDAERESIRQRMAASLRRGEERKKAKQAEAAWDNYLEKWQHLKNSPNFARESNINIRQVIPWPVVSGAATHISQDAIELFLRSSKAWEEDPLAILKIERVRWHPDKMQQRFGQHIDTETMKSVTAVFQVIYRLWNARR